jgi:hypothetical protein
VQKYFVYLSDEVSISTNGALHNIVIVKIARLAGFFVFSDGFLFAQGWANSWNAQSAGPAPAPRPGHARV